MGVTYKHSPPKSGMPRRISSKFLSLLTLLGSIAMASALMAENGPQPFSSKTELYQHLKSKRFFDFELDQDLNQFPDDWFIEKGPSFESYHKIALDKDKNAGYQSSTCLHFGFSGGKVGVTSAPLLLENRFAYNITCHFRSSGLNKKFKHVLTLGLKAYDRDQKEIGNFSIDTNDFQKDWQEIRLLRIETLPPETTSCTLYLHLAGRPSGLSKLWIDQVQIESSPRIRFITHRSLNTFESDEAVSYEERIEGTEKGMTYQFTSSVKDFMGSPIGDEETQQLLGKTEAISLTRPLPEAQSGVYYVASKLMQGNKVLVSKEEIVAKDSPSGRGFNNPSFGVLIGRPKTPFGPLMDSMKLLGTSISKLELFPEDFSFSDVEQNKGLPKLNPLLRTMAPDMGYKFIAVLNRYPQEFLIADPYRPPAHVVSTFPTAPDAWIKTFDQLVLQYGNVFSDWQLGTDNSKVPSQDLSASTQVIKHLQQQTEWMDIYRPDLISTTQPDQAGFKKNLFISATMTDSELLKILADTNHSNVDVTIALDSNRDMKQLHIIENLVRRITHLKAAKDQSGQPLTHRLFIDQLSGKDKGLMTESYQPQSTYFAAKTMIYWMDGAQYVGKFQNPDHQMESHVFTRGEQAFAILWRKNENEQRPTAAPIKTHLGRNVKVMDLMGNTRELQLDEEDGFQINLGATPVFVISPYPHLWKTIISLGLTKNDLKAKVQFQNQGLTLKNHFDQQVKMDMEMEYPMGFELETKMFSSDVGQGQSLNLPFRIAPSPLFPLNLGVPLYVNLDISLLNMKHKVKVYREDTLNSDVILGATFSKKGAKDLEMIIRLELSQDAQRASTFMLSAQLPTGQVLETFFKGIQPNENRQNTLFILDGQKFIGKDVVLTARENIGQRYLNAQFTITPTF
jgi:hypothetical protein